jgi:hypothetical protein
MYVHECDNTRLLAKIGLQYIVINWNIIGLGGCCTVFLFIYNVQWQDF